VSEGDGRFGVGSHGADAHGASGGSPALLAAVRDGGELRGFAGLQGAAGIRELAPGDQTIVALHGEDLEHGHRRFPSLRTETPMGMAHVSHVGDTCARYRF